VTTIPVSAGRGPYLDLPRLFGVRKPQLGDGQHQRRRDRLCEGRGRGLLPRRAAGALPGHGRQPWPRHEPVRQLVARLPVREVVGASHYVTDLTLGLGEVVFDYLKDA
jgi:hypothetical protein